MLYSGAVWWLSIGKDENTPSNGLHKVLTCCGVLQACGEVVKAAPGASIVGSSWYTSSHTKTIAYETAGSLASLPANRGDVRLSTKNSSAMLLHSRAGASCQGGTQLALNTGSSQDAITCPYCPKVFPQGKSQSYQRHVIVHTDFKPFACKHCDYKGNQASNLRRHERMKHPVIYSTDNSYSDVASSPLSTGNEQA